MIKHAATVFCCCLVALPAIAQRDGFTAQVETGFAAWDTNADGILSKVELDLACANPENRGRTAATLAVLKTYTRRKQTRETPLTREVIGKLKWNKAYQAAYSRIQASRNAPLFGPGSPNIADVHQGRLGDCYALAPLGALLHRDPRELRGLYTLDTTGGATMAFPTGHTAIIPALTDAQIALTSTSEKTGRWVSVYESAIGYVKSKGTAQTLSDAVAGGGSARPVIELLTGHEAVTVRLKKLTSGTLEKRLQAALQDRRLICASTPDKLAVRVPGLTPNHAYAVLAYDAPTKAIRLWNPHGSSFTPEGAPGKEKGYTRRNGRCPYRDVLIPRIGTRRRLPNLSGRAASAPLLNRSI